MLDNSKNIIKNFLSISSSKTIGLLIDLVSFALIARYLEIKDFGTFSLLIAIVGILSKIIDLGISPIIFRENSEKNSYNNILSTAISLRLSLFLLIVVVSNLVFFLSSYNDTIIVMFNILLLNIILSSKLANIRDLITIPYKVNLKMQIPSILNILDASIFLLFVLFMTFFNEQLVFLTTGYVLANLPGFLIQNFFLYKNYKFRFKITFYKLKWLLKESAPLAGFVIFMSLFQQIDLILLDLLKDSYAIGVYSIALRLVSPLNLIPSAIVMTIFPVIVRDKINKVWLIKGVYKILFFLSIVIASVFSFKSSFFINFVFGAKYTIADSSTIILFWMQIFIFFNSFSLSLFTAQKKQILNFYYSIIIVLANIILGIILIPELSFLGAAIAKFLSSFVGIVFIFFTIKNIFKNWEFLHLRMFIWLTLLLLSLYLISNFNIILYLFLSFTLIFIITIITQYFNKKELKFFLAIIK